MFVGITKSSPPRYVRLVEAYRDGAGRPKQRTVATLGHQPTRNGSGSYQPSAVAAHMQR